VVSTDVHQIRWVAAADAWAVPAVGHQFSDPNPERFPALGRDFRPLAWVAKESAGAVNYPAPMQPGAHLAVEHRPADDSLVTLHLGAVEPLVAPEGHQSVAVLRVDAVRQES